MKDIQYLSLRMHVRHILESSHELLDDRFYITPWIACIARSHPSSSLNCMNDVSLIFHIWYSILSDDERATRLSIDTNMKLFPWTVLSFVSNDRDGMFTRNLPTTYLSVPPPQIVWSTHQKRIQINPVNLLGEHIRQWLLPPAEAADVVTPSAGDIDLLRQAMAAYYNQQDRDVSKAEGLLTQAIQAWQSQPVDELAGLYRIRADCYMSLLKPDDAIQDYSRSIKLLQGPGGQNADPSDLPAAYLGRARAIRGKGALATKAEAVQAAEDYKNSIKLSSREDWDTEQELLEDGASRNPYATWEWGSSLRAAGRFTEAADIHVLASVAFLEIGDRARSVISLIDSGIDLAAGGMVDDAIPLLKTGIKKTVSIEGRDIELLQRVVAKEGEGRLALSSILWESGELGVAEKYFGDGCLRLEQLEQDAQARNANRKGLVTPEPSKLKFSIDDQPGVFEVSCSKFKNEKFLTEVLQWPDSLKQKVTKLNNLSI